MGPPASPHQVTLVWQWLKDETAEFKSIDWAGGGGGSEARCFDALPVVRCENMVAPMSHLLLSTGRMVGDGG